MKLNYKKHISRFLVFAVFFVLVGCNGGGSQSNSKEIQTFSLQSPNTTPLNGVITDHNIAVTVPYGTIVTALIATFTTTGTKVEVKSIVQASGITPNDFTKPLVYTVTAADSTTATYTVTVKPGLNPFKDITAYSLGDTGGEITGNNITVTMPFGTSLTALIATFTTTGESVAVESTVQKSGVTVNNFTNPVVYTVTAADGGKATYKVTARVAESSEKDIAEYSLGVYPGVITGESIAVALPYKTDVKALAATFIVHGKSITVGSTAQISGVTKNNFSDPVVYTVTAADNTTATYTVTVAVEKNDAKQITSYSLRGYDGVITGQNIAVTLPFTVGDLTALPATFTTTGTGVKVGSQD